MNFWLEEEKKKLEKEEALARDKKSLRILGQFKLLVKGKNFSGEESNSGRIMVKIQYGGKVKYVSAKELKEILEKEKPFQPKEKRAEDGSKREEKTKRAEEREKKAEKSAENIVGDIDENEKIEPKNKEKEKGLEFGKDEDEDLIIGKLSQKELKDYRRERTRRGQPDDLDEDLIRYTTQEREAEEKKRLIQEKINEITGKETERETGEEKKQAEDEKKRRGDQEKTSHRPSRPGGEVENYSAEEFEKRQQELAAFLAAKPRSGGEILEEENYKETELQLEIENLEREIEKKKEKYQKALAKFKKARQGTTRFQKALSIFERGKEFFGIGDNWEGTIWTEKKKAEAEMVAAKQELEEAYLMV